MKKHLLRSVIAYTLISAKADAQDKSDILPPERRFKSFLLKPAILIFTLVIAGLFFSGAAFGQTKIATISVVPTQTGVATYGTAASVTYKVTITTTGNGNGNETLTFNWIGTVPAGVTLSPATDNPKNQTTFTLTVQTASTTAAGTFNFTITATHTGGTATSAVQSSLVIGTKALTITATGPTKTFGTALIAGASITNFTAVGTANGETVTSVTLTPDANGLSANTPVGTAYVVTPSSPTGAGGFLASNYNITFNNYHGTVAKAPLTITANNQNKTYGTTFTFAGTEFTTAGLVGTDAITSVTLTSAGSAATATVAGGPYTIVPSAAVGNASFSAANYTITYVNGAMTLIKATLTVTGAAASNKVYDGTTAATVTGTLSGVLAGDIVTLNGTGTFASVNVGAGIAVTSTSTLGGASAANYTLTQPTGLTANITGAALTITATGPAKTYGTILNTGTSGSNFTATGAIAGETVTSVTLTADANGQAANTPVGTNYAVTPSLATGTGGFLAGNYNITYSTFTGTVTTAALIITATGPSLGFGAGFANGAYTTNFVSSTTAVAGEAVTGVTLTGVVTSTGAAITAATAIGQAYTITPSLATGNGGFLATNYTITYVVYNDVIRAFLYNWTGASDINWANSANWASVPAGGTYPQTVNDDVAIGVTAYATTNSQPTINSAGISCSSLTFGANGGNPVTLTVNAPFTLTVASGLTLNAGAGTANLVNNGTVTVNGGYTNNTGETFNINALATGATGSLTIGSAYNNSGTTNFGGGTVTMNSTYGNTGTTTFGAGTVNILSSYNNSGTTTFGSGPVTMSGSFTNAGPTTFGTGLVTFNVGGPVPTDFTTTTANPITFINVAFSGGGKYKFRTNGHGAGGTFNVASTGVLTLSNSSQVIVANATCNLLSDASGSATIAAIPANCSITGTINVQRYVQANRGYRLISSPVYNAPITSGTNTFNDYSLNYVKNTSYLTGTTGVAGGFDKTGNPTLYLYRENLAPLFTTFLNSNFRGINDITQAPDYTLDVDGGPYDIPAGNGFLFFYRGDRSVATLAAETMLTYPATAATLTASGTLNTGSITVTDWYTPGSANLGFTNVSGDPTVEGINLVGNPYPSSIDWDQYGLGGITSTNVAPFSYQLVPGSDNYGVYQANSGINPGTNGATNVIASGEGFFVYATNTGAALTFTEAAKTNAQVTGAALFMSKTPLAGTNKQYLRLRIELDSVNSDETIIRFNDNTKGTYDPMEDARYKTGAGKVSLASLSSDNVPLAINQLPLSHKGDTIALKVGASTDGHHTLSMKNIVGIPSLYDILLMDAYKNRSLDMRHDSVYNFDIFTNDPASYGSSRFSLVIRQNPALGVKLLNFTAVKSTGGAEVKWNTVNEQNYTYFTVERSNNDGKTFMVIGSVASDANGAYSLLDKTPPTGADKYRLKIEDLNGTITYSNIVTLIYTKPGNHDFISNISVYPNPAAEKVNLTINQTSVDPLYTIRITNSTGSIIKTATSSQASWQTDISRLMPGTYFIQVLNQKDNSLVGRSAFVKL